MGCSISGPSPGSGSSTAKGYLTLGDPPCTCLSSCAKSLSCMGSKIPSADRACCLQYTKDGLCVAKNCPRSPKSC
eukprot:6467522-Amphidinium_carterae.1